MYKEHEGFRWVTSGNTVELDSIGCHILMVSEAGVQQAWRRNCRGREGGGWGRLGACLKIVSRAIRTIVLTE